MLYEIIPGGVEQINVQIIQDQTRIPMLELQDWDEYGENSVILRERLMAALALARVVLPHHVLVTGPKRWPDAPGLELGLLVRLLEISGAISVPPGVRLLGWGSLDGVELLGAPGAYALARAAAAEGPVWLIAPRVDPRVSAIPGVRVFDARSLADLLAPLETREIFDADPYSGGTPHVFDGDPPEPEIMRAIEVAIAGRFAALIVARDNALGDWRGYAAAVLPLRSPEHAREGAARASCYGLALADDLAAPVVHVTPATKVKALRSNHIGEHAKRQLGVLARAHGGLLICEGVDEYATNVIQFIGDAFARRGEYFGGKQLETRPAMVAAMPPCTCTLPRCWCPPALTSATRSHVRRSLRRLDLYGAPGWWSRPIFMSPAVVRERIAQAWRFQDAELGEGNRYGDQAPSIAAVVKVLKQLDPGAPEGAHETEARALTKAPW